MATFYVTEDTGTAIIGLPSLQAMKIVNLNHELKTTQQRTVKDKEHLIKEYPEVFRGIGKFQGTYHIHSDQYKFLRNAIWTEISQDIFQSKIDQTFEGCSGVIGIADDIVVSGKTEKEHDINLHNMIQRCEETGLKLNPDKCRPKHEDPRECKRTTVFSWPYRIHEPMSNDRPLGIESLNL
ncbi:hypothetical protein PoB_005581300 [Plakobranchus ocellatus]|uniref:Reverse transcriptase domain-containing protein n=1 Tax=Plakobranchus ocellatus TaxID=259542 RepID=A0AAV4CEC6_9GAST|nr:hypothetical protein PoB_005581300 [Plakobranchus ocellatus]